MIINHFIIQMKYCQKVALLFLLGVCLQGMAAFEQVEIPIKASMIPLPDINDRYSIVRSDLYPKEQFTSKLPHDFYVTKAINNRPAVIQQPKKEKPQADIPIGPPPAPPAPPAPPTPPKQQNKPQITSPPEQQQPQQQTNNLPQSSGSTRHGASPVDKSSLDVNDRQHIRFQIQPPKTPHPYVLENGVQQSLTTAFPKGEQPPLIEVTDESKFSTELPHAPQVPTSQHTVNPETNIQTQTSQTNLQTQTSQTPLTPSPPQQSHTTQLPQIKNHQREHKRFLQNENKLYFLSGGFLVLIIIFFVVRANKLNKEGKGQKLPTRVQTFKVDDEDTVRFRQKSQEFQSYNPTVPHTGMTGQDSQSDEDEERHTSLID